MATGSDSTTAFQRLLSFMATELGATEDALLTLTFSELWAAYRLVMAGRRLRRAQSVANLETDDA